MDESKLAKRLSDLGTETAFEVLARAKALEAQGREIIHLEIGEPDFDTPQNVTSAAIQALKDGYRQKVALATKLPTWLIEKYEDFDHYLNEQLEKLQTDRIDFYLLHGLGKPRWPKIRDLGVTGWAEKAIADGRKAATAIDCYLRGEELPPEPTKPNIADIDEPGFRFHLREVTKEERCPVAATPAKNRKGNFKEVNLGFTDEATCIAEARRCLTCRCTSIRY